MIIWGSKQIRSVIGGGYFVCPECCDRTTYSRVRVTSYFTLYFIPLFPTNVLAEYIACGRCAQNFEPSVLERRPVAPQAANRPVKTPSKTPVKSARPAATAKALAAAAAAKAPKPSPTVSVGAMLDRFMTLSRRVRARRAELEAAARKANVPVESITPVRPRLPSRDPVVVARAIEQECVRVELLVQRLGVALAA